MQSLSGRIKKVRTDYGLNQVEFAKRLGVTNAHISKLESGKTLPSISLIKLICSEFKINEAWLSSGKEPMMLEDLETEIDQEMMFATDTLNRSLRIQNPSTKIEAAKLFTAFAKLIDSGDIIEEYQYDYLKMCQMIIKDLTDLFKVMKNYAYTNQQVMDSSGIGKLFYKEMDKVVNDLYEIRFFFEEQNRILCQPHTNENGNSNKTNKD